MSRGELDTMVAGIREALQLDPAHLSADVREQAGSVIAKADERLRLGDRHTVVAFAGSTGSGKSSLFNAVSGLDIARVGVRRPTTSRPTACVWGEGGEEILSWLKVPVGNRTWRESALDADDQKPLHGLILVDLPDHDSTEPGHRLESDRMVELVDVLIWVVDPQKYADWALHEHYLSQLSEHAGNMVVVLNQVDRLGDEERRACSAHLRRLLREDGLGDARIQLASALTNEGIPELRTLLADTVKAHTSAEDRVAADVRQIAGKITDQLGEPISDIRSLAGSETLIATMEDAAGVSALAHTVRTDHLRRGYRATGYPPLTWLQRTRPDPLGSRHQGATREDLIQAAAPTTSRTQRSRVNLAAHAVVEQACARLPYSWQAEVAKAEKASTSQLTEHLDEAVTGVEIVPAKPGWWAIAGVLQLLFFAATIVGLIWLAIQAVLMLTAAADFSAAAWIIPAAILGVGIIGSIVTCLVAKSARERGATKAARDVENRLKQAIRSAADTSYLAPIASIVDQHRRVVEGLRH